MLRTVSFLITIGLAVAVHMTSWLSPLLWHVSLLHIYFHEGGHALGMILSGVDFSPRIEIYPGQGGAAIGNASRDWWQQVIVSVTGLIMPALVAWMLVHVSRMERTQNLALEVFAAVLILGSVFFVRGEISQFLLPVIGCAVLALRLANWWFKRLVVMVVAVLLGTSALSDVSYMMSGSAHLNGNVYHSDTAHIAVALHGSAELYWVYGLLVAALNIYVLLQAYKLTQKN